MNMGARQYLLPFYIWLTSDYVCTTNLSISSMPSKAVIWYHFSTLMIIPFDINEKWSWKWCEDILSNCTIYLLNLYITVNKHRKLKVSTDRCNVTKTTVWVVNLRFQLFFQPKSLSRSPLKFITFMQPIINSKGTFDSSQYTVF